MHVKANRVNYIINGELNCVSVQSKMTLESAMHMIKPSVFRPVPTDAFMTDCPLTVIAVDGVKNEYYLAC